MSNQKGFSLIEALVGVALLGLVAYFSASFQASTFKSIGNISNHAAYSRAISSIQSDVLQDYRSMPQTESLQAFETVGDLRAQLEASFTQIPASVLESRCYDQKGGRIVPTLPTDCFFKATYYRISVKDMSLPATSNMRRLPMSRINAKIEYVDGKETQIRYISRLVTDVIPF